MRNLKMTTILNIIQNCPVTVEDIEIAEKISGPNVSSLKVRTAIKTPKVVVDNFIEIPIELIENNQELILFMDTLFINQQALFTKIDRDTRFRRFFPIANRKKEECCRSLDVVMRHYNRAVFSVKHIECDRKFK